MTMKIELDRTERPNCFELWRAERRAIKLLYVIGDKHTGVMVLRRVLSTPSATDVRGCS